jgi:excisionase family DNA binding protein
MPEHREPARPQRADGHGCTCGAHPITRGCPVDCLAAILSGRAFNPLARACDRRSGPGATVGHVVDLHLQGRLGDIQGLGPRRIGEIAVSLVFAGLIGADGRAAAAPPTADSAAETDPDAFPEHMTLAEVAAVFRVHSRTIIRWADAGILACFRTAGGHRRFRAADVRALLAAGCPPGLRPLRDASPGRSASNGSSAQRQ